MAPKAARVILEVMENPEERGSTRLAAASEILDRAYGKSMQSVQHEAGGSIAELFRLMDEEKKKSKTITVSGVTVEEAVIVEDGAAKWVETNL